MPQSLVKNFIHITFSTKNRYPFINNKIEDELYKYIGGICKRKACNPIIVGGHIDHIHILCLLSRKITLMKLIEEIKTCSSKWIKKRYDEFINFYWQKGYGGFSTNPHEIGRVRQYIIRQKEHHKKMTFQEEFRMFLEKYNVEYDERYVWD